MARGLGLEADGGAVGVGDGEVDLCAKQGESSKR